MAIRLLVIIGSFVLMFGYYVILPYRKGRKFKAEDFEIDYAETTREIPILWGQIKKNASVFFDTLLLLKQKFVQRLGYSVIIGLCFAVYVVYITPTIYYLDLSMNSDTNMLFIFSFAQAIQKAISHIGDLGAFFEFYNDAWLWPILSLIFSALSLLSLNAYIKSRFGEFQVSRKSTIANGVFYFISFMVVLSLFFINETWVNIGWRFVILFMLLPIVFWVPVLQKLYVIKLANAFFMSIDLFFRYLFKLGGFIVILLLLGYLIQLFFDSPILYAMLYLANEFVGLSDTTGQEVLTTIVFTFSITGVAFIFQVYFTGMAIFIDSVHEIETATTLKKNIKAITLKRKIYGVESE